MNVGDLDSLKEKESLVRDLGIEYVETEPGRVVMTMPVDERHHQPLGFLHGGASVVLAETVATTGAWLNCPEGKVAFGSTVTLREDGEGTVVYQLVMPEDADAGKGLISTASPIGRALLGKEEGDEVTVPTPNGQRAFELLKLVTIHD